MPNRTGSPIGPNEVENLAQFIIDQARNQNSVIVTIKHEILKPLLVDQEEDRIRIKLNRKLIQQGITIQNYNNDGYTFKIGETVMPLNQEQTYQQTTYQKKDIVKTLTGYKTPFYPPPFFPDLVAALRNGLGPILVGPTGCGKSRCLEEAGAILGLKQIRIPLGIINDPSDLIGTKEIVNDNGVTITKFIPGPFTQAAMEGQMVILDEFDSVHPQVSLALHMALESDTKIICLTEHGKEEVERHPNTRICATANTWGYGDESGLYSGTEIGNRATWNRFAPAFDVDYNLKIERQIAAKYLHPDIVDALFNETITASKSIGIIPAIRASIKAGDIRDHLATRSIERFAYNYKVYGWHKGLTYFILNTINPAYRQTIQRIVTQSMGNIFAPSINDFDADAPNYIPDMEKEIKSKNEAFLK